MAVLGNLLAGGDASVLYQGLVKGRELALNIDELYGLTDPWTYDGPTLYVVYALYKPTSNVDALLGAVEEEVGKIAKNGVEAATLKRVKTALLAGYYNDMEMFLNRADRLAKFQTLWGDANVANKIPGWIEGVTSADIQRVAQTYLTRENRTVIDRKPVPKSEAKPAPAAPAASDAKK